MFKPVHGLRGVLQVSILAGDTSVALDSESMALLRARLGTGNHTYALIRNGYAYEVVKLTQVYATTATVVRAQDGTVAQAFLTGSQVEFVLGESAIADIILEKTLDEIQITGSGVAEVVKTGPNTYNINVPEVTLVSESPDIIVEGEYPEFVISAPIKSDCCD